MQIELYDTASSLAFAGDTDPAAILPTLLYLDTRPWPCCAVTRFCEKLYDFKEILYEIDCDGKLVKEG